MPDLTDSEADRRSRDRIADRMGQIEAKIERIRADARRSGPAPWHAPAMRLLSREYESLAETRFALTDRLLMPELYPQ